jgi:regulator of replication initiation timing
MSDESRRLKIIEARISDLEHRIESIYSHIHKSIREDCDIEFETNRVKKYLSEFHGIRNDIEYKLIEYVHNIIQNQYKKKFKWKDLFEWRGKCR